MRSRSNSLEEINKAKPVHQQQQPQSDTRKRCAADREEPSGRAERRSRHHEPPDDTGTVQRNHKMTKNSNCASGNGGSSTGSAIKGGQREKGKDLSRDDLVFLLSLLEGELQVNTVQMCIKCMINLDKGWNIFLSFYTQRFTWQFPLTQDSQTLRHQI